MFNLLKIAVDNDWDLNEEEKDEEQEEQEQEQEQQLEEVEEEEEEHEQQLEEVVEEEEWVRPLKKVDANSKMLQKRTLFIPSVIQGLLRHASDEQLGGRLDATMAAKFFLIVLFSKLLIPVTSNFASSEVINAVQDLEHLKTIDWSGLVFKRLQEGILAWQNETMNYATGCVLLPMVHPNVLLLLVCSCLE